MPVNRHDASHFRKSNWSATSNQFTPTNGGMHRCGYRYKLLATVPLMIAGNGTKLAREETVPNTGKSHSAVRYGFAGRWPSICSWLFSPICWLHWPDEQLLQWKEWSGARDAAFRDSAPGGWQLISGFLLSREVNPWNWLLLGWVGTLLVGSQVMKLIMEGIH